MSTGQPMSPLFVSASTVDDLLYDTYTNLTMKGVPVTASRGETRELTAVTLELTNPLARLSRSESRGKVFSCLGELSWYLAGDNTLDMIGYYIPQYDEEAVDGIVLGAYGPRLFSRLSTQQVTTVLELLKRRPTSRRAVLQLFEAKDLERLTGDVPCTCVLQLMVRKDVLDLVVYMRSNDSVKGLPHDIFCFTMLQELFARALGLKLGSYSHMVGSLHYYTAESHRVDEFVDEGFQSTKSPMLPMPDGDPWPAVNRFLKIEESIRRGVEMPTEEWAALPTYWQELALLLVAFRARQSKDTARVRDIRDQLAHTSYYSFLNSALRSLENSTK
jgi:thymidylate synthase